MTMFIQNLFYNEVCYKGTALYNMCTMITAHIKYKHT